MKSLEPFNSIENDSTVYQFLKAMIHDYLSALLEESHSQKRIPNANEEEG